MDSNHGLLVCNTNTLTSWVKEVFLSSMSKNIYCGPKGIRTLLIVLRDRQTSTPSRPWDHFCTGGGDWTHVLPTTLSTVYKTEGIHQCNFVLRTGHDPVISTLKEWRLNQFVQRSILIFLSLSCVMRNCTYMTLCSIFVAQPIKSICHIFFMPFLMFIQIFF